MCSAFELCRPSEQLVVVLKDVAGLGIGEPVLRSQHFSGKPLPCGDAEARLPGQSSKMSVDAKCGKSLGCLNLAFDQPMDLLWHGVKDKLPGGLPKGLQLLPQSRPGCSSTSVVC